jgi:hypothetical protein
VDEFGWLVNEDKATGGDGGLWIPTSQDPSGNAYTAPPADDINGAASAPLAAPKKARPKAKGGKKGGRKSTPARRGSAVVAATVDTTVTDDAVASFSPPNGVEVVPVPSVVP